MTTLRSLLRRAAVLVLELVLFGVAVFSDLAMGMGWLVVLTGAFVVAAAVASARRRAHESAGHRALAERHAQATQRAPSETTLR